jgi:Bacterial membrane protein YfhO
MIPRVSALLSLLLYAAAALFWAALARALGGRIPSRYLVLFLVLPILFLLPAFVTSRTIFPVDHALSLPPWLSRSHGTAANPNLNDVATEMAPWAKAVREAWREGSIPWRNRWNACGSPLAANGQSAPFSPLTILGALLPLPAAFNFLAAIKIFAALSGFWLWLSELGVRARAALFGAIVFGLSFTMVPWLLFPHTSVIALWPWALYATERLRISGFRGRAVVALTAIWMLQILAGHPESVLLGVLFAALWLAVRAAAMDLDRPVAVLGRAAGAGLLALGLCAFLLVPHLVAIRDSNRAVFARSMSDVLPVSWKPHGPVWPYGLLTALLPRSLGDAMTTPMISSLIVSSFPEMALGHFGLIGWAAALLVFRKGSKRSKAGLALLAPLVLGFGIAILLWPVFDIFYVLPGVKLMLPLRFFTWVAFAGSAVAAFEIDRLQRDVEAGRSSGRALLVAAVVLVMLALLFLARLRPLHEAAGAAAVRRREVVIVAILLAAAAIAGDRVARRSSPHAVGRLPLILAILAATELGWAGRRLYRMGPSTDFYPPTPLVEFLRRQPGTFRVVGDGPTVYPSTNVFASVEDVRIHDPVERRDYVEWLDRACGYDPAAFFKHVANADCAALDFLNVKYFVSTPRRATPGPRWRLVYSGNDGTVFENRAVLPRVFPVEKGAARVTDYVETTNAARFRAAVSADRAVLATSLVQDGGWTARDETGATLPVGRANGPFLSITVPRGEHRILLTYVPPGARTGGFISLAGLVVAAAAVVVARRHPV